MDEFANALYACFAHTMMNECYHGDEMQEAVSQLANLQDKVETLQDEAVKKLFEEYDKHSSELLLAEDMEAFLRGLTVGV